MQNILPPGLAGYALAQQQEEQRGAQDLQKFAALAQIKGVLQKQQEEQAIKGILSGPGTMESKLQQLMMQGPTGITIGSHLADLAKKQATASALSNIYNNQSGGASAALAAPEAVAGPAGPTQQRADMIPQITRDSRLGQIERLAGAGLDPKPHIELMNARFPKREISNGVALDPYNTPLGFVPQMKVDDKGNAILVQPGPGGLPQVSNAPGSLQAQAEQIRNAEGARLPFGTMEIPSSSGANLTVPKDIGFKLLRERFGQQQPGSSVSQPPFFTPYATTPSAPSAQAPTLGVSQTPAAKALSTTISEGQGKAIAATRSEADLAVKQMRDLNSIDQMLKNFDPSKLTPAKKFLGEWAQGLGMSREESDRLFGSVADMQSMTGAINKIVASAVRQTDAQPAVRQIEMMRQAYPQIDQTGEGAQMLLNLLRRQSEVSIEKHKQMTQALRNGMDLDEFESRWNTITRNFDWLPEMKNYPLNKPANGLATPGRREADRNQPKVLKYNPVTGRIE